MYRSFIQALSTSASLPEVCGVFVDIGDHYGFEHCTYTTMIPVSLISPRYLVIERIAKSTQTVVDCQEPMSFIRQYVRTDTPENWNKSYLSEVVSVPTPEISDDAASYGHPGEISVPIHSYHAGSAVVDYSAQRLDHAVLEKIERAIPELYLLAAYMHEAVNKFIDYDEYEVRVSRISKREKECLIWSTEGMTTSMISEKLGITHSTVTFHLHNAMHKLGANNRQQAVARAIMLGVI